MTDADLIREARVYWGDQPPNIITRLADALELALKRIEELERKNAPHE